MLYNSLDLKSSKSWLVWNRCYIYRLTLKPYYYFVYCYILARRPDLKIDLLKVIVEQFYLYFYLDNKLKLFTDKNYLSSYTVLLRLNYNTETLYITLENDLLTCA
jgi:hypothetical protein